MLISTKYQIKIIDGGREGEMGEGGEKEREETENAREKREEKTERRGIRKHAHSKNSRALKGEALQVLSSEKGQMGLQCSGEWRW